MQILTTDYCTRLTANEWDELLPMDPGEFILSIEQSLKNENRFFVDPRFLKIIYEYACESPWKNHSNCSLSKGKTLYRARIYKNKDAKERLDHPEQYGSFQGYDEDNSFVPKNNDIVDDGRVNPSKIIYLYTASDVNTTILEVMAQPKEYVSVATIKTIETVKMFDVSKSFSPLYDSDNKRAAWINWFYVVLSHRFQLPYKITGAYYLTQYVSEFIKNLGFDGIIFQSSKKTDEGKAGLNYTFFNYEKCKAVSSALCRVNSISVSCTCS